MFLSIFEIFKVGIGPSSSHTMGPMVAAAMFLDRLRDEGLAVTHIRCHLRGSLAFTGRGHASDRAVALGLLGFLPATLDPDHAVTEYEALTHRKSIEIPELGEVRVCPSEDIILDYERLDDGHPNQLSFEAFGSDGALLLEEAYYSIGGGFVHSRTELDAATDTPEPDCTVPYPFANVAELLDVAGSSGLSIAQLMRANETSLRTAAELDSGVAEIWAAMRACMERGFRQEGRLPGGLNVKRRAPDLLNRLHTERGSNQLKPYAINDWLTAYAMAVNEENAAGGRVVTAPTNGAAGVVPAVLRFFLDHCRTEGDADPGEAELVGDFLLTAAAIGGLIKRNASISGAEAGCQGEVGVASAMAAAGFCALSGGTPEQIENAAEIALEHHLGMTCDPVAGLVQVPCIERNGFGAIKAVAAASLSLRGDGKHFMPLDNCIEAMRQTGLEMNTKYKETSLGGLAVNVPNC